MVMKEVTDAVQTVTQPVTITVGSAMYFGLTVDDMIKVGTLLLLLLNIPLAFHKLLKIFRKKDVE